MPGKALDSPGSGPASGPSSPESLASWDPSSLSWRTSQLSLLEGSTPFSARWPTSGTTRNGALYARPTWAPRIDANGSSLWPTPDASAMNSACDPVAHRERQARLQEKHGNGNGAGDTLGYAASSFTNWPTLVVSIGRNRTAGRTNPDSTHHDGETIHDAVRTWATPRAEDGERGQGSTFDGLPEDVRAWATPSANEDAAGVSANMQEMLAHQAKWFHGGMPSLSEAPTAPSDSFPAKPLRRMGLNPIFAEWLMGFPRGWIMVP